jgi:hypothetical protein
MQEVRMFGAVKFDGFVNGKFSPFALDQLHTVGIADVANFQGHGNEVVTDAPSFFKCCTSGAFI